MLVASRDNRRYVPRDNLRAPLLSSDTTGACCEPFVTRMYCNMNAKVHIICIVLLCLDCVSDFVTSL